MYAIVDIQGQQFKVEKDQKIFVHRIAEDEGKQMEFNKVLLVDAEDKTTIGTPHIEDATISVKILKHLKGDKVQVFKKKRRKGYQKLNGHRQYFSQILIEDITFGNTKKKEVKEAVVEEEKKEENKIPIAVDETVNEEAKN